MKKKKQRLQNLLPLGTVKELIERYEYAELQMELKRLCKVEMLPLMLEAYNRLRTVIPKETDKVIHCDRTLELTEKEVLAGILWEVAYYKDCYLKNIEKTDKIG